MEMVLSCLGLRDKSYNVDFPSPRYHSAKLEKPGIISSNEKKTTFTVLVTGMGVSNVIQFLFLN